MKYILSATIICLALTMGCKKKSDDNNTNNTTTPTDPLITYKNSAHHIFIGYLVGDGNDPVQSFNPANAPDSVDYLEFFAGNDTVQADWRVAQNKGTKIVTCHFVKDAYFDGSAKDPATKVAGYVNPPGFDQNNPTVTSTYYHWAKDMYNKDIVTNKLDGIDLDIESGTFGGDVKSGANGDSLVVAIARYYGPNCTECTVMNSAGKKPVFFYDTDGTCGYDNIMFGQHKGNYDYVLFQSYTTGSHAWTGTDTNSFAPLVTMYGLDKLIFLVNGDSFKYPNGSQDVPGGDSIATASLYNYATYVKNRNGAGVGVYRMSRDYNHKPPFAVSNHAIQIMNPAK
ncbi:MAG: hypothetical protein JST82_13120 [Bacteroidetes bacterium]|nr:hypothetical protein [Bacteroidota bacterium]